MASKATALNIRRKCFVLRTSTKRQEAVDAGFAELVGVEPGKVLWRILNWWHQGAKVPARKSPFGSGTAAERTLKIIQDAGYR